MAVLDSVHKQGVEVVGTTEQVVYLAVRRDKWRALQAKLMSVIYAAEHQKAAMMRQRELFTNEQVTGLANSIHGVKKELVGV